MQMMVHLFNAKSLNNRKELTLAKHKTWPNLRNVGLDKLSQPPRMTPGRIPLT